MAERHDDVSSRGRRRPKRTWKVLVGLGGAVLAVTGATAQLWVPEAQRVLHPVGPTCSDPGQLLQLDRSQITVTASSELAPQGRATYVAQNVLDGSPNTAWIEGSQGDDASSDSALGVGSTLDFTFASPVDLRMICVLNGYGKTAASFEENSRIGRVGVRSGPDADEVRTSLPSKSPTELRRYDPVRVDGGRTSSISVTVLDAVPGARDAHGDTAVSEVRFFVGG